jgi:hypothetical protein
LARHDTTITVQPDSVIQHRFISTEPHLSPTTTRIRHVCVSSTLQPGHAVVSKPTVGVHTRRHNVTKNQFLTFLHAEE